MKIVVAVHHFPPRYTSGAELQAYRTICALRDQGHQAAVVCVERIDEGPDGGVAFRDDTYGGIAVRRLSFRLNAVPDPFRWAYDNPWIGEHLREYLANLAPDVLHLISGYLMSGSTLQVATELHIPTVVTLTDFWFLCPRITLIRSDGTLCTTPVDPLACAWCLCKEKRRYRFPDRLTAGWFGKALTFLRYDDDQLARQLEERKAFLLTQLGEAKAVISVSRFVREVFEHQGVHLHRFLHVRQGMDTEQWAQATTPVKHSGLHVGYIGQIAPHKGVHVLLDAFLRLHRRQGEHTPQLLLYGDLQQFPQYTTRLRRGAVGRNDVIFAGRFDRSQIRRIHAGLDVLVVPSLWYENSPNVILEAFACGTPVVVSRLGGMAELVEDGVSGLYFEPGDVQDLTRMLQRLVDEPGLLTNLSHGIPLVKTNQEEIAELLDIYRDVCDGIML